MMLIYWAEAYLLWRKIQIASKGIGLEVNTKRGKYMVMSRDQKSGQNHNIKLDNKGFEWVEQVKYLVTIVTN
jgi:hypothetical protein